MSYCWSSCHMCNIDNSRLHRAHSLSDNWSEKKMCWPTQKKIDYYYCMLIKYLYITLSRVVCSSKKRGDVRDMW